MASADSLQLVMFDIDGTLVDSAGFDGELYARAVETELGIVVDRNWDVYEHVSDSGILAQLLRGSADRDELAERVRRRFVALVRAYSEANPAAIREIAGAKRLLERLCAAAGVRVAVATGGWEETARLKLAHVGIDASKIAFASSSDAPARADIMQLAAQRAMQGAKVSRATYFGDGPWDRRASEQLGYDFIAVGSTVPHHTAFADLHDTDAIIAHLLVPPATGVTT
jgi:phosphoglycolate phosphatase-like HAD superfamily hydrolase